MLLFLTIEMQRIILSQLVNSNAYNDKKEIDYFAKQYHSHESILFPQNYAIPAQAGIYFKINSNKLDAELQPVTKLKSN